MSRNESKRYAKLAREQVFHHVTVRFISVKTIRSPCLESLASLAQSGRSRKTMRTHHRAEFLEIHPKASIPVTLVTSNPSHPRSFRHIAPAI